MKKQNPTAEAQRTRRFAEFFLEKQNLRVLRASAVRLKPCR